MRLRDLTYEQAQLHRTLTHAVYRSRDQVRVLTQRDTLDGADVVPGFAVPVKEIFGLS
jgi:hypothetical protein